MQHGDAQALILDGRRAPSAKVGVGHKNLLCTAARQNLLDTQPGANDENL
jgi:hypothetical protein